MASRFSATDAQLLVELAWRTFQGAKRACGGDDELTMEVRNSHATLEVLQSRISNPGSSLNLAKRHRQVEVQRLMVSCKSYLRTIDSILAKYNALNDEVRRGRQLWKKIRIGNGEVQDLADIRLMLSTYTVAIEICLRLISQGPRGPTERQLSRQRGHLDGLRESVDIVLAHLWSKLGIESIAATSLCDKKILWRRLRRGLLKDGFPRSGLHDKKVLILAYVTELDNKGVFEDPKTYAKPSATKLPHSQTYATPKVCQYPSISTSPVVLDPDDVQQDSESYSGPREVNPKLFYQPCPPKGLSVSVQEIMDEAFANPSSNLARARSFDERQIPTRGHSSTGDELESCPSLMMSSRSSATTDYEECSIDAGSIVGRNLSRSSDSSPEPRNKPPAIFSQFSPQGLIQSEEVSNLRRYGSPNGKSAENLSVHMPRDEEAPDPIVLEDPFGRTFSCPYFLASTSEASCI